MDLYGLSSRPPKATSFNSIPPPGESGRRYEIHGTLGTGGMAVVYDATEVATGRRVALKRLQGQSDAKRRQRNIELFEREFHALSQLAHPRIVEVYGYGVDAGGVHYTMELLDGGDLQQQSPLPWRTACAIARDICSALSLLHSRRLVHRDVSPRNVRRAQNGFGKLIDFGALAPMGASKIVVGTPPCCAPESVHLQWLDGRTDLYALGATLYYSLVGRHAYAARHFAELKEAWSEPFSRPSELVADIPEALDALVLDLLRLEPDARPANAAEVMQRLAAIEGVPQTEQLQVAQAYLSTPNLVGREELLLRVRSRLKRAVRGRQQSPAQIVVLEGDSGVGRSRFLDACVLDATLFGAAAARADSDDAISGDYGVVRALSRQLLTVIRQTAIETARPWLPLLTQVVPELRDAGGAKTSKSGEGDESNNVVGPRPWPSPDHAQLQAALRAWLAALCRRNTVVLAVDDFQRSDEASKSVLALLGHDAPNGLFLLISSESDAAGAAQPAQKLLAETATHVRLDNLTHEDSESLLRSLFGDVPNLSTIARHLYDLSLGNPRDLLRLAQHLVDRRAVRYEAGAWTLPPKIDAADLPTSMADALRARVAALQAPARSLASAFALCIAQNFTFEECIGLSGVIDPPTLMLDLDELIKADIVRRADDRFGLSRTVWAAPLCSSLTPELERELHVRLAQALEQRQLDFRAGQHWLRAGHNARALEVLVAHAADSQEKTARDAETFTRYARSLPSDWFETYMQALRLCETLHRPKRDAFTLRARLAGIVPAMGVSDAGIFAELLTQLQHDSGLDDWKKLDPALAPLERIQRAVTLAKTRYDATPARDRVLEPRAAMPILGRVIAAALGGAVSSMDIQRVRILPSLAAFAPIASGLAILDNLCQGLDQHLAGRLEVTRGFYRDILIRLEQAEPSSLDAGYGQFIKLGVMNALGIIEAVMGLPSSLHWAEQIATHPSYVSNSWQTRVLHHLYQGNVRAADDCKRHLERMRIEQLPLYQGSHLIWEVSAYTISEDLTRLRHTVERLSALAQVFEPWKAVLHHAIAEYHRIRGDSARALAESKQALEIARPGLHPLWANIASGHVRALYDSGRHKRALSTARSYLADARSANLGYGAESLWMALALCEARMGHHQAEHTAEAVIGRLASLGIQGLHLGQAHETRARVALSLNDSAGFARHAELCQEAYGCYRNPALLAKYRRLRQEAERSHGIVSERSSGAPVAPSDYNETLIADAFEKCQGSPERARLALDVLVKQSGAQAGWLLTREADDVVCAASLDESVPTPELMLRAAQFLEDALKHVVTSTHSDEEPADPEWHDQSDKTYRALLLHHPHSGSQVVMGLALLVVGTSDLTDLRRLARVVSALWADSGNSSMLLCDT